jgi:uncharacterized protein YjaZ
LVKGIISKYAKKVETLLPFKINNFTFTVYAWEKDWISSFTQAIDWVQININYKQLNKKMIDKLIYIIYHEMHHACRGYAGYLPKNKEHILINSIISEGLADHFALEQHVSEDVLENTSYDLSEINQWIKKLGKVLWNKESADDSWIFGAKGKPKLLGYKIGRYIIQEVKERNPKLNSVNLVNVTPEKLLKLSGIKF